MGMDLGALERHELSALWGDMPPEVWESFEADIAENGVRDPITLYNGKVLDGWHRVRAAIRHGQDYIPIDPDEPEDPAGLVIRKNALRRPLTKGQRVAMVLEARSWRDPGRPRDEPTLADRAKNRTARQLAEEAGASTTVVEETKKRIREGHGEDLRTGRKTLASIRRDEREQARETQSRPLTRMERLQAENAQLQGRVDALEREIGQLQATIDGHERNIGVLKANLLAQQELNDELAETLKEVRAEREG